MNPLPYDRGLLANLFLVRVLLDNKKIDLVQASMMLGAVGEIYNVNLDDGIQMNNILESDSMRQYNDDVCQMQTKSGAGGNK